MPNGDYRLVWGEGAPCVQCRISVEPVVVACGVDDREKSRKTHGWSSGKVGHACLLIEFVPCLDFLAFIGSTLFDES